jgi:hypothetical protein
MLQSAVTFPRSDVVISNATGVTTNFFRAYEVGAGGNNAGFSMGATGSKGSIYGASGVAGLRIVGGNPGLIQFGYSTGDTSVYANYSSLGTWSTTGLGVGTDNPGARLDVRGANQALGSSNIRVITTDAFSVANAGGKIGLGGTYNSSNAITNYVELKSGKNNGNDGDFGGYFSLFTQLNSTGLVERIRVTSDGQSLFGLTGNAAPASASTVIYANGNSASLGIIGARNGSGRNVFSVIGDSNFDCGYVGIENPNGTSVLLEVNGSNGVRFTVSGSERGRFIGNDFMVGTTSTDGDIGNGIGSITGRTKTASGTVVGAAGGNWVTIFTIANPGLYIVHAYIGGYVAGPGNWSNAFFISYTGSNPCYVWNLSGASVGPIDVRRDPASNVAIQLYTSAGAGITYTWVTQRIG